MKIKPDKNTINHVILVLQREINDIDRDRDVDADTRELVLRRLKDKFTSYLFQPELEVEV